MRSRCYLCVCIPRIFARQRLGKNPLIVARQRFGKNPLSLLGNGSVDTLPRNTHATIEELLDASLQCGPFRIKESRRLVLPRTSCFVVGSWHVFVIDVIMPQLVTGKSWTSC
jgi:hypothetical protein